MIEKILPYFASYLVYIFGILLSSENKVTQQSISILTNRSTRKIRTFLRNKVDFDRLFMDVFRLLNIDLTKGNFSFDGTIYAKPYARVLKYLSTMYSPSDGSYTKGCEILLLTWSNGIITLPVCFRIWYKGLGKTKIEIALELIKYAQTITKSKNLSFRFDAFFNKKRILGYLQKNHIFFVTRLEKSRVVLIEKQRIQLKSISFNGRFFQVFLPGVGKVWITKYKRKFYCSNVCPNYQKQLYEWYAERWTIECVFRFVKSEAHLEDCQSTDEVQNYNHIGFCFLSYALLVALFPQVNVYEAKRLFYSKLIKKREKIVPLVLQLCA